MASFILKEKPDNPEELDIWDKIYDSNNDKQNYTPPIRLILRDFVDDATTIIKDDQIIIHPPRKRDIKEKRDKIEAKAEDLKVKLIDLASNEIITASKGLSLDKINLDFLSIVKDA